MDRLDGFRDFVAARGPAFSRMAYLLTGDHATAEDVVQEALIKTALRWRRVQAGGNPEAYVRQVILNQFRTWWSRRRRLAELPTASVPETAGRDDEAATVDRRLLLASALATLPPRQRAVLYLRYYEDRTEAETAAELGCTVGTVKRHAHDALARLRGRTPALHPDSQEARR